MTGFGKALEHVRAGGKARRPTWDQGVTLELVSPSLPDGRPLMPLLVIDREGQPLRPFGGAGWDLLAEDWELD